jgi:membrane protein DedA with SNARE-associated domain
VKIPSPRAGTSTCGDTLGGDPEVGVLQAIEELITTVVANFGYLAIFVLMLLESACIPVPSEVTMLFGGAAVSAPFLAPEQQLGLVFVIAAGVAGNVAGSWLAYWAGYKGGRPLIDRFGKYLLMRPHEVDRAHEWFERHGEAAVFFSRLLPVLRTFISLPAGVAGMPFGKFTLYTTLGCIPWTAAFAIMGYYLGENWHLVDRYFQPISIFVGVVCAAGILWWIVRRLQARRRAATPAE